MDIESPSPAGKNTETRAPGGRFAHGNTEGLGRPKGSGTVGKLRETLATDLDKIIDKLKEQALAGDPQSIRIILDRVLPTLRPVELPVLMNLPTAGSLVEKAQAVVQAASDGELAPSQAAQLVTALGGVAKIIETTELLNRIAALEAANIKDAE